MKAIIAIFVWASLAFCQVAPVPLSAPKVKHAKLKKIGSKFKHEAKIGAEVVGGAVVLGLVIVGSGGAAVKVY